MSQLHSEVTDTKDDTPVRAPVLGLAGRQNISSELHVTRQADSTTVLQHP